MNINVAKIAFTTKTNVNYGGAHGKDAHGHDDHEHHAHPVRIY